MSIIFDKDNNLVYKGPLTLDKQQLKKINYRFTFIPKEILFDEWIKICQLEYRGELETSDITEVEKKLNEKI